MKWVKLTENVWISEREVNFVQSRIKQYDDKFYAYGENHGQRCQQTFDTLKAAKSWIQNNTGWSASDK